MFIKHYLKNFRLLQTDNFYFQEGIPQYIDTERHSKDLSDTLCTQAASTDGEHQYSLEYNDDRD
jgi:hypothetical protein